MTYAKGYIQTALKILMSYQGEIPLHLFLRNFFSKDKKYGSKDRKQIASFCYNYFRLGHAAKNISEEDRILLGTFLCENESSEVLKTVKPDWNGVMEKPLEEKFSVLKFPFSIKNIFPFADELSEGIDVQKFNLSFLIQPDLFLRVRPGNNKRAAGKLAGAGLSYKLLGEDCIALPNASKIDTVIKLDKEAIVQDYNSQRAGEFLKLSLVNCQLSITVWDCCAASGGKSIMAYDINPDIQLTVSDKRESILQNLHKRFASSGIKKYNFFIADLAGTNLVLPGKKYDFIICDAPCTGSGTWARTPEQLFYFKKESIQKYSDLQKQILKNIVLELKPGGQLLYITCSVFKKENEEIVKFAVDNFNLKLQKQKLLKGYEMKADTMFAALFTAQ